MRNLKTVLSLIRILLTASDLLMPGLAAFRQIVALDLLPEMLIIARVYDKKILVSNWLDIRSILDEISYGGPN